MIRVAYHPIYEYPLPEGHRFPMEKYGLLKSQLLYEGSYQEADFFTPQAMSFESIGLTHSALYLDKLNHQLLSPKEIRKIGFPMTPLLVERGRHIAKGTYDCAKYALQYGIALNIAGGTHHAFADHGEGFCIFNDIALAANALLVENAVKKVLVIDLDVHQGNGTAAIFSGNDAVFTFSMHGDKNYPLRKEKSDLDIGLPDHTEDKLYLSILKGALNQLVEKADPDLIFYQSGVDVLKTDRLGRINLSMEGCKVRDELVFLTAQKYEVPIAVTMGGGYSHRLSDIINAHANTFRTARQIFG